MEVPVKYNELSPWARRAVRGQYIKNQNNKCIYCGCDLDGPAPDCITSKYIDWNYFPSNFREAPVHLQHSHITGMTEGAVHSYCNAVMWQYENK